ncbi:MAG TPA: DHH family phosphoesterase [Bdellovibrionota bacterium]|nr:DHH family phosphoesterase [Bdellovibrionota bacterium]
MTSVIEALKKAKQVLILSHRGADGDAIGSTLAIGIGLEQIGKKVVMFNQDVVPLHLKFLPSSNRISKSLDGVTCDAVLILDCADLDRAGETFLKFPKGPTIINIDHHGTNTRFGDSYFIEPNASSTGEVIFDILQLIGVKITKPIATNLFCALISDTGSFRYRNTSPKVLHTAAALVDAGASPEEIGKELFDTYPVERLKVLNRVLDSLSLHFNGKVAILVVTDKDLQETGATLDMTEGFVDLLRRIDTVEVAVLLKERNDGTVKMSTRARRNIDVGKFCQVFGGGGHKAAAGANISGSVQQVIQKVLKEVEPFLP